MVVELPKNPQLTQGKAYQLFLSELERHLGLANQAIHDFDEIRQHAQDLAIVFHTIKGSAGFFGLGDVAKTAGKLEDIFEQKPFQIIELKTEITSLVGELEHVYQDLLHTKKK